MSGKPVPVCLSIAGLDPSGGAGVLADVKTFSALGCYGAAAVTALTAQNTLGVSGVWPVEPGVLEAQLDAFFADFTGVHVKVGMVATPENVTVIMRVLTRHAGRIASVVYDPVMASTSGASLLTSSTLPLLRDRLFPLCTLVTPNLPEACRLWGCTALLRVPDDVRCELVPLCRPESDGAVLLKGGHLADEGNTSTDFLVMADGVRLFTSPRVRTQNTHGTGCTLSSAVTAFLALGHCLPEAVGRAKDYLTQALEASRDLVVGAGHGAVNHFYAPRPLQVLRSETP